MKRIATLALFALLFSTATSLADGGGVRGYVYANGPAAGALVVATGPAGTIQTQSDANGFYAFLGLLPGDYQVIASKEGFHLNDCSGQSIAITSDQVRTRDVYLDPDTIMGLCRPPPPSLLAPDDTADVYDVH